MQKSNELNYTPI